MSLEEREDAIEFAYCMWEHINTEREFLGLPGVFDKIDINEFMRFFVKSSSYFPSNRGLNVYTQTPFSEIVANVGRNRFPDSSDSE